MASSGNEAVSSQQELPASSTSAEQDLVSDFQHLGIAVRSNENDTPNVDISPAALAARAAFAKHSQPNSADTGASLHRTSNVDNIRDARSKDSSVSRLDDQQDTASKQDSDSQIPSNPDTTTTTTAKPVVHETIKIQNHEIRQEVVHKDIHEYHEVTHILPVIETVVLPARHFIETEDGRKVEIPAPKGSAVDTHSMYVEDQAPVREATRELPTHQTQPSRTHNAIHPALRQDQTGS